MAASDGTQTARFVGTVLFSDIVDSTLMAEVQGDAAWIHVLDQHDAVIDREVARFGGRIINHTGDGILGVSDAPGQAVQCALSLHQSIGEIGLKIHTGEIDRRGHDIGGIAVHIAARVLGKASPGEVLVSRTVVDLTAGAAILYEPVGEVDLKGLAGRRELFRAIHSKHGTKDTDADVPYIPAPDRGSHYAPSQAHSATACRGPALHTENHVTAATPTDRRASLRRLPTSRRITQRAGCREWSPGELDLDLPFLVTDLDLELEVHLVGHVHREAEVTSFELHLVVAGKGVGECMEARSSLFSAQPLLLRELKQVHRWSPSWWFTAVVASADVVSPMGRFGQRPVCASSRPDSTASTRAW